jgi:hypothetical protein
MKNAVLSPRFAALSAVAATLLGVVGCSWSPWSRPTVAADAPAFAADALADYLPPDAGAVYTVNQRQTLNSPAGRKLAGPIHQFLDKEKTFHPWLDCLGADPIDDVAWTQAVFCPPDLNQPLLLFHGRFDPARFSVGPGKLREASEGPFRFYQMTGLPGGATAHLAPVGDVLAVSLSRPRFLASLSYAVAPRPVELQDAGLREMLGQVDHKAAVWFAVSFTKLGPIPRLTDLALETVLRPVLRHAESLRGQVQLGDGIQGEFVFRAKTDADAAELDQDLKASCEIAQGAYLVPGVDPSLFPLLQFAGTGTTSREGRVVTLRCELPADRLGP